MEPTDAAARIEAITVMNRAVACIASDHLEIVMRRVTAMLDEPCWVAHYSRSGNLRLGPCARERWSPETLLSLPIPRVYGLRCRTW
ncbi:hypothetical protein D3C77_115080 [compost metagenome]